MLMSGKVFKKTEITRTSTVSSDDAIQNAIARANRTVRNMRWFEVVEQRGAIGEGEVAEWQVTLKIGFALED
jgi:flavin-binding protein dodecin